MCFQDVPLSIISVLAHHMTCPGEYLFKHVLFIPSRLLILLFSFPHRPLTPLLLENTTFLDIGFFRNLIFLIELRFLLLRQQSMVLSLTSFHFQQSEVLKSFNKLVKIKANFKIFLCLKEKKIEAVINIVGSYLTVLLGETRTSLERERRVNILKQHPEAPIKSRSSFQSWIDSLKSILTDYTCYILNTHRPIYAIIQIMEAMLLIR